MSTAVSPPRTPTSAPRLRSLSRTMLIACGFAGAGWAVDVDTTPAVVSIQTDATGIIGSQQVTNRNTAGAGYVTFTVTFDQPIFPLALRGTAIKADGSNLPTFANLYDLFTITGSSTDKQTVKQLNGKTFEISVTGLADAATASVAVAAGKWAHVNSPVPPTATLDNLVYSPGASVKVYLDAKKPTGFVIATPAFSPFTTGPTLTGTVTKTGTAGDSGDNPNGSVITLTAVNSAGADVTSTLGGTAIAAGTAGVWSFSPATAPPNGYYDFAATATDAAGNSITLNAGSTTSGEVFFWKKPKIKDVKQVNPASTPMPFTSAMKVKNTKPAFSGWAGIDHDKIGASGNTNKIKLDVDIFSVFSNDGNDSNDTKAITTITKNPTGSSDGTATNYGAVWSIADTDYSAALTAPPGGETTYTIRVRTQVVSSSDVAVSTTWVETIDTFTIDTDAAVVPALAVVSTRPQHLAKVRITGVTLPQALSGDNTRITMYKTDAAGANPVKVDGKVTDDNGATAGGNFDWVSDDPLADGTYYFRATYTDDAGSISDYSTPIAAHIIATPTPVLAKPGSGTGTPGVGAVPGTPVPVGGSPDPDYQYIITPRRPVFKVSDADPDGAGPLTTGNALTANGTIKVYMISRSTSGLLFDADATGGDDFDADKLIPGAFTATGDGHTYWQPTDPLVAGSYSVCAKWEDNDPSNGTNDTDTDGAGPIIARSKLTSVASNIFNFRILSTVDKPAITHVYKADGTTLLLDTSVGTTEIAQTGDVVLKGTGNPGAALRVFNNGVLQPAYTIPTPGTGAWTYRFTGVGVGEASILQAGTNKLTVQQVDLCGTTSAVTTTSINVVVDGAAPAAPVVTSPVGGSTIASLKPTFTGTALPNSTVVININNTDITALNATASSTGAWSITLDEANKLSVQNYDGSTAAKTIKFKVVSAAGVSSAGYTTVLLNVIAPAMVVDLQPLARGTASKDGKLLLDTSATGGVKAGTVLIKVLKDTGGVAGTILSGDEITLDGNTYIVNAGNNVPAAGGGAVQVTLRSGIKALIAKDAVKNITINANPNAPVSKDNTNLTVSSLSSILLTATLKDGAGKAIPSVLPTAFTKDKVKVTKGTVTSVTKGTGLPGQQATNVWTIAITPDTGANTLEAWIPEGAFSNAPGKYVSAMTVTAPGAWYSDKPTVKITGSGYEASIAAADISLVDGVLSGLTILNGGSGYTSAPTVTIAAPTSGVTATAVATISAGAVSGLTITNYGSGYTSAPAVTIADPTTGITAKASSRFANKGVAITMSSASNGGWGYSVLPTVTITPPGGVGGKATATAANPPVITVTAAGSGYSSAKPPVVRLSTGEGATARAVITGGKITAITRLTGGQYYSGTPTVTITDSGGGAGATATATISGGVITGFTVGGAGGSGYTANTVVTITPAVAENSGTATVDGTGKITAITGSGNFSTAAPYVIITTGGGATATPSLTDGTLVFNKLSDSNDDPAGDPAVTPHPNDGTGNDDEKYSLLVNRSAPTVTWRWAADTTAFLKPSTKADGSNYATGDELTGLFYVNQQAVIADTEFKVRASFSPALQTADGLQSTDLTVSGCIVKSITKVDDANYDILLDRDVKTGTVMSVIVKAGVRNGAIVPVLKNLASKAFTATLVVASTTQPTITSTVGATAPANGAKTPSYPCTVSFPNPVREFDPTYLTVTNGVITKFAGSGKVFTFTLTPGEGPVEVQYVKDSPKKVYDVAGNEVPTSTKLTRLMDSTQPVVAQISSPVFKKMNSGTAAAATASLKVVAVNVTAGGSGYTGTTTATISGGGGAGATATVTVVGDVVTGVTITAGGTGFTSVPTIAFTDAGSGTETGATATVVLGVDAVTVGQGGLGFAMQPAVTFTGGGGAGAAASAAIDVNGTVTGITVSAAGSGYTSVPTVVVNNSIKPMNGGTVVNRFPVRVTFSERPAAFPTASLVASATGLAAGTVVTLEAPKAAIDLALAQGKPKPIGPQVVAETGGTVYEFDLVVPTPTNQSGAHEVRLVVPSQGVGDGATNAGQASQVFGFTYDMINGMPVEVTTAPVFANG